VGLSGEGRDVLGVEVSTDVGKGIRKREKMGFVITGAQHAREWIATATSLYLTHALVANSSSKPQPASVSVSLNTLLDKYNFYIIPAPNPDGYDYTWESDRFWYKNRMKNKPEPQMCGD